MAAMAMAIIGDGDPSPSREQCTHGHVHVCRAHPGYDCDDASSTATMWSL